MDLSYAVVLRPEVEGGYSVSIPAFPEAHTQGQTVDDAIANAREVIALSLEARNSEGLPIPSGDAVAMLLSVRIPASLPP